MALYELLRSPGTKANTVRFILDAFAALLWIALFGIGIWRAATSYYYDYLVTDPVVFAIAPLSGVTLYVFYTLSYDCQSSDQRQCSISHLDVFGLLSTTRL